LLTGLYILLALISFFLGPFHGAIAVPSVTRCRRRCRCRRGHRCAGGARQFGWRHLVNWREAARSGEWAQHFSNASCFLLLVFFNDFSETNYLFAANILVETIVYIVTCL